MAGGSINFGMWKLCLTVDREEIHLCAQWKHDTTFDTHTGMLKTLESEGTPMFDFYVELD